MKGRHFSGRTSDLDHQSYSKGNQLTYQSTQSKWNRLIHRDGTPVPSELDSSTQQLSRLIKSLCWAPWKN